MSMTDAQDGMVTDGQHKKWDPAQPIHRINSPAFNPGQGRPSGDGVARGCRLPAGPATGRLRRVIPAWVRVENDPFKEVEGELVRSFQTWTDFPLTQWHKWYDWNFHLVPASGYTYLRGLGNETPTGQGQPVVPGPAMECEWDTGAFGSPFGPMFDGRDWAWPMARQFVWLAGRWIYDCGHANAQNKMRSELHPCGAVAAARWEGQQFASSAKVLFPTPGQLGVATPFVPGVQILFFASQFGGYVDLPEVFDRDYEFIVDLPREQAGRTIVAAGEAPDHPVNNVVVGPLKLVADFNFSPFSNARGPVDSSLQPILDPKVPSDGSFPIQVKVTIPLTRLKATGAKAYGVLISLGLVDGGFALAKRVLQCFASFDTVQFFNRDFGDVALKFGVNGRWRRQFLPNVKNLDKRTLTGGAIPFALALDHPPGDGGDLLLSSHGKILKLVGRFLQRPDPDRLLRVANQPSGRVFDWFQDIDNPNLAPTKVDEMEITIADALKGAATPGSPSGEQNEPLGIADFKRRLGNLNKGDNPFTLKGFGVEELGTLAELVFRSPFQSSQTVDYVIEGKVNVRLQ